MDCKKALEESSGDLEKAILYLRKKGIQTSSKKAGRITKEGQIASYIHLGGKIGVLIELNCETDFVARTKDFQNLVKDLCMHIAASNPLFLERKDVQNQLIEKEKEIYREQAIKTGKPEKVIDKIISGKLEKFYQEVCLVEQPFVKNPDLIISDLIKSYIGKLGENIKIRRFIRYQLGEEL
jgi:elongation factor Ts